MSIRPLAWHLRRALGAVLAAQLVLALALLAVWVMFPLTEHAARDKAAFIVLSAQTWLELPPLTRPDFEWELRERHGLILETAVWPEGLTPAWMPYPRALQHALAERTGSPVTVGGQGALGQLTVAFMIEGRPFVARFAAPRLLGGQVAALALVLLLSTVLAALMALWLTRRLTRPLEAMTAMAARWERGEAGQLEVEDCDIREVRELGTRLVTMQQAQRRMEQERATLLAGISHDLRTPLARLRLALEMLPAAVDERREAMIRDVEAMDRLIGQALAVARGEPLPLEDADLAGLVGELVEGYRRQGRTVPLAGPAHCPARIAPQALRRILGNLLDNAVRYGGESVEVQLSCTQDRWRVEVLDRGPGVPDDMREAIFAPFVRLEPSRNAATGGSGLGLAIARQLARAQGWRVGLAAREGGGSCAWVESGL
ncbi:MAG: sensor histidine kinase [Pseudomonadota bacterium]|jgi:two-component system osmolarity sensor histidine kinase EnvZ